jgi:hypothetical protein
MASDAAPHEGQKRAVSGNNPPQFEQKAIKLLFHTWSDSALV